MSESTELTHVTITPIEDITAEWAVSTLEATGGNIKKWLSQHPQNRIGDEELVIARTQQWLAGLPDKKLLARWDAAKRQNRAVRLELILEKSLERLETLCQTDDWTKIKNEAAAHKLALGALLVREAQAAKRGDIPLVDEPEEDTDAEAAANY